MECRKKQKVITNGDMSHRCMHRNADTFRLPVTDDICSGCPLRIPPRMPNVARADPTELPIVDVPEGQFPSCEYRASGYCMITKLAVTPEICHRCVKESVEEEATLTQKFHNYRSAIRKWVAAGKPTRTAEEVQKIHDEHCVKCHKYDPNKKACKSCGCLVNKGSFPLTNKLKMATESCPLGRW